jgi:hypothetical protein
MVLLVIRLDLPRYQVHKALRDRLEGAQAIIMFGVIGGVVSGSRYANCKSDLEAQGYTRVGRGTTSAPALAAPQPSSPTVSTPLPPSPSAPRDVPTWKPGDEWSYRWESPRGKGTFVWVVDREDILDGTAFFVVKSGTTREIYYRKSDFAYYMDRVDGKVETRHTPPSAYVPWPPVVGGKVELSYMREQPLERQSEEVVLTCEASAAEPVTVPAGTFDTVKVTCRNSRTNALTLERWLSPAIRQMVRERTYFSYGTRDRELIGFKLSTGTPSASTSSANASAYDRTYAQLQACGVNANGAYIKPDGSWWLQGSGNTVEDRRIATCMGGTLRAR